MHERPRVRLSDETRGAVPTAPGVYAWYREGEAVYIGTAPDLRQRMARHGETGRDLSRSAFRRSVVEFLGIARAAVTKRRPPMLTLEQIAPAVQWVSECEVAWIECATADEAKGLERRMKDEWKPPLTKR